jgi:type III secretion system YscD/HrpQ family protein
MTNPTNQKEEKEDEMESRQDSIFDENTPAGKDALAEINFELVDTGRWLLKVIGGPNTGAEFSLQASNSYVIGTDPNSCDIVFHDTSVSRQHARVAVSADDVLTLEDMQSRNGTLIDGEPLKTKKQLMPNVLVTLGTTSFILYDRDGEVQTIISPLLPSIVKVLKDEESRKQEVKEDPAAIEARKQAELAAERAAKEAAMHAKHKAEFHKTAFIAIALVTGLVVIAGVGTISLFQSKPVVIEQTVDIDKELATAMKPFPSIKYSFNKTSGKLLLIGHVLTSTDINQLRYNLQDNKFIKSIDDSDVIIDEYVWQEMNQLLSNNPNWKGVTVNATSPGHFVLLGYLQTLKQAEALSQYVSENFHYLDLLEKKIVVDEDIIATVSSQLQTLGIKNLAVQMSSGELTISGSIPTNKAENYNNLLAQFKVIPGVRNVKNYVSELPPEQTLVNISDKYSVTGYSNLGNTISVVINGRILSQGDSLDGMTITSIKSNSIMLEKDGVKYRIDYSR